MYYSAKGARKENDTQQQQQHKNVAFNGIVNGKTTKCDLFSKSINHLNGIHAV